ncbi:MAG: leucyl/phenylalanyl-tRNA--protein transferase [Rhodospirillales bacterium]
MRRQDVPELSPELLLRAYASGIFPMAENRDDPDVFWVDPRERGVLPLDGFHIPRSLRKTLKKNRFTLTCNRAFDAVIEGCAESAEGRSETWINAQIVRAYCRLHALGFAHSVETWEDGRLVGGLYGVAIGGAFCGESMFSRATDASKVALVQLVARLRLGGYVLLDTQFITDHLKRFGAIEIPSRDYLQRLDAALAIDAHFPGDLSADEAARALSDLLAGSTVAGPALSPL